jgi:cation transport ATPase
MFKIVKDQRQRMASELVLQPQLQSEQVQSEQVQSEQVQSEQLQSEQVQSEQVQSEQVQSEQVQSEQVQSEQVQSEQVQSEQVQSEQVQSEQVQSEQVQSEQVQSEQVQSEKNMTWLRHLAKELKAMKTFAIIVGVLTFCFVPYIVTNIIRVLDDDSCVLHTTYLIILHLVGVNSIANAFIYALKHKKYIRAYRKLLSSAWARLFPQNN